MTYNVIFTLALTATLLVLAFAIRKRPNRSIGPTYQECDKDGCGREAMIWQGAYHHHMARCSDHALTRDELDTFSKLAEGEFYGRQHGR